MVSELMPSTGRQGRHKALALEFVDLLVLVRLPLALLSASRPHVVGATPHGSGA
jgi:hypothetical protein